MKYYINKIKSKLIILTGTMMVYVITIYANNGFDGIVQNKPTFDTAAANDLIYGILTPITNFSLGLVPAFTIFDCMRIYYTSKTKDEQEQEQKPVGSKILRSISIGLFVWALPIFLKIMGF